MKKRKFLASDNEPPMEQQQQQPQQQKSDLFDVPVSTELSRCGGFYVLPVRFIASTAEQQAIEQETLSTTAATSSTASQQPQLLQQHHHHQSKRKRFHNLLFKPLEENDELPESMRDTAFVYAKCLLVTNVPSHYDSDALEEVFGASGAIERIEFADVEAFGVMTKVTVVVFRRASSIRDCCSIKVEAEFAKAVQKAAAGGDNDNGPLQWCDEFWAQRPPVTRWRAAIDKRMQQYDRRVEEEKRKKRKLATQMDADGFVVVQSGTKKRQTVGSTSVSGNSINGFFSLCKTKLCDNSTTYIDF
jgi:hypothetical protein